MPGDIFRQRERVRAEIESRQRELLARCFPREGQKDDLLLAERCAALMQALVDLPREQLLRLTLLGTGADSTLKIPRRSRTDELLIFRRLADASGYGFAVTDMRCRLTYANPALCRMLGISGPDVAAGRNLLDFYSPVVRSSLTDHILPQVLEIGQWTGELPLGKPGTAEIATYQNYFILRGGASSEPYLANLIIDISQRRRIEDALRISEERFRAVFENSAIGIYRTTPEGRVLLANPALQHMLGFATFDELSQYDLEAGGFGQGYSRDAFKKQMEVEGEVRGHEAVWLRSDGTPLHVRESARAIRAAAGHILYYEGTVEDVSEIHRAHEALRTSEENFRAIAENANDAILIVTGPTGRYVYANPRASDMSGYRQEDLLQLTIDSLTHPDDLAVVFDRYTQRMAGAPAARRFESRLMAKDGRIVPVEVTASVTAWFGERADVIIARDMTNRKLTEQALRESQERYRRLAEDIDEIIYEFDEQGCLTYISPTVERILGWNPEEMLGRTFVDFVPPEDQEEARERLRRVRDGQGPQTGEIRILTKGGELRWLRHQSRQIEVGGRVTGMRGITADITEQKAAEHALRESEERYRRLVEEIDHIIYECDRAGRIVYVSPAVEQILGYRPEDIIGHTVTELLAPGEQARAREILDSLQAGVLAETQGEFGIRDKSGAERWVHHFSRPVYEDGKLIGARGSLHEITRLKQSELALAEIEAKCAVIVEHARDLVIIVQDDLVVFANPSLARVSGFEIKDLIGKNFAVLISPESRARIAERHQRLLAGENEPASSALPILCSDGSTSEVQAAAKIIQYGGRDAILVVARDLAEVRKEPGE